MAYLKDFKNIVDGSLSVVADYVQDHKKVCSYLNIDTSKGYVRDWVVNRFKENIETLLKPTPDDAILASKVLQDIQDALIYEAILEDRDNSEYITVMSIIRAKITDTKPLLCHNDWHSAVVYAKDYDAFSPGTYTVNPSSFR